MVLSSSKSLTPTDSFKEGVAFFLLQVLMIVSGNGRKVNSIFAILNYEHFKIRSMVDGVGGISPKLDKMFMVS